MSKNKYSSVSAKPVKRFFVEMLTRDIELEDAILDLLDNCVDGIQRSKKPKRDLKTPYAGFWAKISIEKDSFTIEDNCGGIPWGEHDRAFRMGRPASPAPAISTASESVGVYGIGMKRAIFKMGRGASIWTQNGEDNYVIPITTDWLDAEDNWDLDVTSAKEKMDVNGTRVTVTGLYTEVSERFIAGTFFNNLLDKIESHYAVILGKGFQVMVNKTNAKPKPIEFRFAPPKTDGVVDEVRPYIFRSDYDNIQVFVAVGLREPIPDMEKTLESQEGVQFSSDYAGWTVICNDRVVLYCDRSELTGWGTANIPRYHTQFIAISGVVEFRGDPAKLPTTTTKRGLNLNSSLYQQVLNRMRDGLRLFIDFTNKWKMREDDAKSIVSSAPSISYTQLRNEVDTLSFNKTKVGLDGEQYKPKLPMPPNNATDVRISFVREKKTVSELADKLLEDVESINDKDIPNRVGEACFDLTYRNLVKGM